MLQMLWNTNQWCSYTLFLPETYFLILIVVGGVQSWPFCPNTLKPFFPQHLSIKFHILHPKEYPSFLWVWTLQRHCQLPSHAFEDDSECLLCYVISFSPQNHQNFQGGQWKRECLRNCPRQTKEGCQGLSWRFIQVYDFLLPKKYVVLFITMGHSFSFARCFFLWRSRCVLGRYDPVTSPSWLVFLSTSSFGPSTTSKIMNLDEFPGSQAPKLNGVKCEFENLIEPEQHHLL